MTRSSNLTAVILTKDNEKTLPRCLNALKFVGKILVIDDQSIDQTRLMAQKYGAQVLERKLDDFASQRNFALKNVTSEWVLMIDDDEAVTPELASEIDQAIKRKEIDGYQFPRKNFIFGHWVKYAGWYPDWQLHLFRTKKGKYIEKVHEQVKIDGRVGFLNNPLIHYNYETISQYLSETKFNLYTDLEAEQLISSGYQFKSFDLISKPMDEFFRRFFAEKGYQDPILGLVLALLQSAKELVIYAKVWEKQGNKKELAPKDFLISLSRDWVRKTKEVHYWILFVQSKFEKNPFKKLLFKLKTKIYFK